MKTRALRAIVCLLAGMLLLSGSLAWACPAPETRSGGGERRGTAAFAEAQSPEAAETGEKIEEDAGEEGRSEETQTGIFHGALDTPRVVAGVLGALLVCALCVILLMREVVLVPFRKLAELTGQLGQLDAGELRLQAESISGKAGRAAMAVADFAAAEERMAEERPEDTDAEKTYKQRVVDEICSSLLPQSLKDNAVGLSFALAGGIRQGVRRSCAFYDYFFLDDSTLCLVVGQVPGSGIAEALFAVVAQTAIRSRLRMGRSLIETMSDVNAQLYDLGGRNSVCAMVGVLNTVSGRFTFVNAGGALPLLMRSEERFEWLKTPVYAELGVNESVSYRSELLRLNQGDRLFLYTADLGEMENREGERFAEEELAAALNRSRSRTRSMEELLRYVQDEAAAFCESGDDVLSSAGLALEYKKGSRDYVFTTVRGTPENAADVTEFLRRTLEEGGIPPRDRAGLILLADEQFALCCRVCEPEADVKVACAILREEETIHLRMFAPMGGRDPLESGEGTAEANAADYIRTHSLRTSFEAGIGRDMAEIVCRLP